MLKSILIGCLPTTALVIVAASAPPAALAHRAAERSAASATAAATHVSRPRRRHGASIITNQDVISAEVRALLE